MVEILNKSIEKDLEVILDNYEKMVDEVSLTNINALYLTIYYIRLEKAINYLEEVLPLDIEEEFKHMEKEIPLEEMSQGDRVLRKLKKRFEKISIALKNTIVNFD